MLRSGASPCGLCGGGAVEAGHRRSGAGVGFDGSTPQWIQTKHGKRDSLAIIADGVEARLEIAARVQERLGRLPLVFSYGPELVKRVAVCSGGAARRAFFRVRLLSIDSPDRWLSSDRFIPTFEYPIVIVHRLQEMWAGARPRSRRLPRRTRQERPGESISIWNSSPRHFVRRSRCSSRARRPRNWDSARPPASPMKSA